MEEFEGRVAVITGGASGIGLAMARHFAGRGMKLVLGDVEETALDAATTELGARTDVLGVSTDVTDPDSVEALAEAAYSEFGAVHVLCNNAGVVTHGSAWTQSLADWEWVLGVDLWGVIHGVRAFVPRMIAGGESGHVVNTASIAGLMAMPGIAPYDVAKAGVVALSESMHHDLRASGSSIGVSVLCPGVVPTKIGISERNRPGGATATAPAARIATQLKPPPTALQPEQIAEIVGDAIEHDRFWIVTHDPYREWITRRTEGIVGGHEPMVPPVL